MPIITVDKIENITQLITAIRVCIDKCVGDAVLNGFIDSYIITPYNEEDQKHVYQISFNKGDNRTLKIILDLNPDE